jgi:hypothetical protein
MTDVNTIMQFTPECVLSALTTGIVMHCFQYIVITRSGGYIKDKVFVLTLPTSVRDYSKFKELERPSQQTA